MGLNNNQQSASQKGSFTLVASLLVSSFILLAALQMSSDDETSDLAIIFPPSISLTEISQRLAALPVSFVRTGFFENIVIVRPEKSFSVESIVTVGAWFTMSAFINGGCSFFKKSKT
ncbi:hypothetical protein [Sneathiella aquimaris]|uniref:hypothetical protein n=1 Tax=Sneathiella aquimaris TaxID=2599305 RepID=UPI001469E930|nr:hypothetical protein [Sneathiella aquimaris]